MTRRLLRRGAWLCGALAAVPAAAGAADGWQASADGTVYAYANALDVRPDSRLNPGNAVARLPHDSETIELRMNLKAENDALRLTARPILLARTSRVDSGADDQRTRHDEAYLGQWQARLRLAEAWHVAVGRDVLNWGPAQFRSPSSPFYFDNGRSDPMRELSGMDAVKLSWTPDRQTTVTLARIDGSGHQAPTPDPWRNSWLARIDRRGDEWAYGLVAAKAPERGAFYGAHGQFTASDAVLVYGEVGSTPLANQLDTPADSAEPFSISTPAARRNTALLGIAYTFEGGSSLAGEYLHDGHGYTRAQTDAYFERAQAQPALALGAQSRLLGRDYAHLVWQSNLMDDRGYWRLMYTRNLTDGSEEYAGYGEVVIARRATAFALAAVPHGGASQEFSSLLRASITLGLKIAFPCPRSAVPHA